MTSSSEPVALPPPTSSPTSRRATAPARPFPVHLRMRWWRAALLAILPPLLILVLPTALTLLAVLGEIAAGLRDATTPALTPLTLLTTNLGLGAAGVLSLLLMRWIGQVPWHHLLSAPRRARLSILGRYLAVFSVLVLLAAAMMALLSPASMGISSFAITGTTVAMLLVILFTTPLQAAGEELALRGTVMPAIGSWFGSTRVALAVSLLGSSLIFGALHGSADPWLASYYVTFGACMAAMALLSGGLEAPIAFHTANNVIMFLIAAVFSGGEGLDIDRSVGMGGPFMLAFMAMDVLAVGLVWVTERRRRSAGLAD